MNLLLNVLLTMAYMLMLMKCLQYKWGEHCLSFCRIQHNCLQFLRFLRGLCWLACTHICWALPTSASSSHPTATVTPWGLRCSRLHGSQWQAGQRDHSTLLERLQSKFSISGTHCWSGSSRTLSARLFVKLGLHQSPVVEIKAGVFLMGLCSGLCCSPSTAATWELSSQTSTSTKSLTTRSSTAPSVSTTQLQHCLFLPRVPLMSDSGTCSTACRSTRKVGCSKCRHGKSVVCHTPVI